MTDSQFALFAFGLVLVFTNCFWAWHTHVLINKLMSRNYFEFKEADIKTEKPKKVVQNPESDIYDDYGAVREILN